MGLAAANALVAHGINRWAMAGPSNRFLLRTSLSWLLRLPAVAAGLLALALWTPLQSKALLFGFFGGYFAFMVWEIRMLNRSGRGDRRV